MNARPARVAIMCLAFGDESGVEKFRTHTYQLLTKSRLNNKDGYLLLSKEARAAAEAHRLGEAVAALEGQAAMSEAKGRSDGLRAGARNRARRTYRRERPRKTLIQSSFYEEICRCSWRPEEYDQLGTWDEQKQLILGVSEAHQFASGRLMPLD